MWKGNVLLIFVLLMGCAKPSLTFDKNVPEFKKDNLTILDYYILLPTDALGEEFITTELRRQHIAEKAVLKSANNWGLSVLDEPNGYLRLLFPGFGGSHFREIVLWREKGKPDIIGVMYGGYAGPITVPMGKLAFYEYDDGCWTEVTDRVFPDMKALRASVNTQNQETLYFEMPQNGVDIVMGKFSFKTVTSVMKVRYYWNGSSFETRF
jgi:hypothetical protein